MGKAEMKTLRELNEGASQGLWSLGEESNGYRYLNAAGISKNPAVDAKMQWASFARFVVEMEDGSPCCGLDNAAFVVALVNAYRAGHIIEAPE